MGLKQDIVVVSEFSVKTPSGGTRGGTPGQYVERYMARGDAVEDLTPVRPRFICNSLYGTERSNRKI